MTEDLDVAVAAAARGDASALRTIYEALSPKVCGYLTVRGVEDPEGLTNDVFIRVIPRLGELSGGWVGLRAFTFAVAHGRLVDELRTRGRRPWHEEYDAADDPRSHESAEAAALTRVATSEALDVLRLLPDDQRSVIVLRVLGELTMAETAAAIGRSEPAAKKLQAKALATLRGLLSTESRRESRDAGTDG